MVDLEATYVIADNERVAESLAEQAESIRLRLACAEAEGREVIEYGPYRDLLEWLESAAAARRERAENLRWALGQ